MSVQRRGGGRQVDQGIAAIGVDGFKSIASPQRIDIRPLTLLAGVNSSGKSSMMQPLLLLKQTLHSDYDAGPLLLDGANVRFTRADQVLSRIGSQRTRFSIRLELDEGLGVESKFRHGTGATAFEVESTTYIDGDTALTFRAGMTSAEILAAVMERRPGIAEFAEGPDLSVTRFFSSFLGPGRGPAGPRLGTLFDPTPVLETARHLQEIIHVPAWRGDARRAHPVTAVEQTFPGTFDRYVASVLAAWRGQQDQRHRQAERDLAELGLTSQLAVRPLDETELELLVGRLLDAPDGQSDMVNIADVGFGVSQSLPVVVALLTARPGQLVYIEEPEIHLHPRAQVALAQLAVRAAARRVRLVMETHSSLLLRGIQTAVARGEIAADHVALHWFDRSESGTTRVRTAQLASDGSFGEWPVDFDEVALAADRDYLDAS